MYLIVFMYMLFASTFTLSKHILFSIPPIYYVGIRMTIAGVLIYLYLFFRKKRISIKKEHLLLFFAISLLHIYFAFNFEFIGLEKMSSSKGALLYNFAPFFTAFLAYIFLNERMTLKKWIGMTIAFFGFLPILLETTSDLDVFNFFSFSEFILVASVLSSVSAWILIKKIMKEHGYSFLLINAFTMLTGGLLSLATAFRFEIIPSIDFILSWPILIPMVGIIITSNLICYNLYAYILNSYSATFVSFCGFLTPIFAAIFGYVFLSESITLNFLASVVLTFLGLYVFYKDELVKK